MNDCTCAAGRDNDFLNHDSRCPFFKGSLSELSESLRVAADHIDTLTRDLGELNLGGAQNHKLANIRLTLMGEARRVRKVVDRLRGPDLELARSAQQG